MASINGKPLFQLLISIFLIFDNYIGIEYNKNVCQLCILMLGVYIGEKRGESHENIGGNWRNGTNGNRVFPTIDNCNDRCG